jgi:acetyltransferase-like isoleucine patch superfamily enzyme
VTAPPDSGATSFYAQEELDDLGFASLGRNVLLSRKASFYGRSRISIGSHSRIDDFCVLSAGDGGIAIGRHVHIGVMSTLIGRGRIELGDFCTVSGRVSIYSSTDDWSGASLMSPTVPTEFTDVDHRPVRLARHAAVGAGTVILPGTDAGEGAVIGALSLARGRLEPFYIYVGTPARRARARKRDMLDLERRLETGP